MENNLWQIETLEQLKDLLQSFDAVKAASDLLIALYLTLDLARDNLVLGMMLRDRVEGICHHRIDGVGNDLVDRMKLEPAEYSSISILKMIEEYSQMYDDLAKEWSSDYQASRFPLLDWIALAREHLAF